jgi:hypothetical protein
MMMPMAGTKTHRKTPADTMIQQPTLLWSLDEPEVTSTGTIACRPVST